MNGNVANETLIGLGISSEESARQESKRGCSGEEAASVWLGILNAIVFGLLLFSLHNGLNTYAIKGF